MTHAICDCELQAAIFLHLLLGVRLLGLHVVFLTLSCVIAGPPLRVLPGRVVPRCGTHCWGGREGAAAAAAVATARRQQQGGGMRSSASWRSCMGHSLLPMAWCSQVGE